MGLEFKKLTADDVEKLTKYYGKREDQTCDSVILDNFLWGEYYHIRYAEADGKALLWIMTIEGKQYAALPICSMEDLPHYFSVLEEYFNQELHIPMEIFLADEPAVRYMKLPAERYAVEELPDARDYLYDMKKMETLPGKELAKKRGHLNSFKKKYAGRAEYRTLTCRDSHAVWNFLVKWREEKGVQIENQLDYEVAGIHDVLKYCKQLDVRMGGVYIDGELEAFSIGSYNAREKMAIIHIEKANPEYSGLYQFICQQLLIHEFPEATIVNREDDMGLEGLRMAKMSYAPIGFANKFRIRQLM